MTTTIGIDVGNYDTKTQHTTTPSSYQENGTTRNDLEEEYVYYNGKYYSPTRERNNQQTDKTKDDYCLIISLFGIAKEILFQLRSQNSKISNVELQEKISEIDTIKLGVGVPVGHFSSMGVKTRDRYMDAWKNGFEFEYKGFTFNLKLEKCSVFPQDLSPIILNESLDIIKEYDDIYVFGIGGGTCDVIVCSKKKPVTEKCFSIEKGSTVMYSEIIKKIQQEFGKTMDYVSIEQILLNKPSVVDDARKNRIKELANAFADKLVDDFIHQGLTLDDYPAIFIGGGALLMKDALMNNPHFAKVEFIEDINANAKSYAAFV